MNLKLLGLIDRDLRTLPEYCRYVADVCNIKIPSNYPLIGKDAFETATGVHAAAVIKAFKKNDKWLADRVYSGVPAGEFGLEQKIRIGPMSGKSNIIFWLEKNKIKYNDELVEKIFTIVKQSNHILEEDELFKITG